MNKNIDAVAVLRECETWLDEHEKSLLANRPFIWNSLQCLALRLRVRDAIYKTDSAEGLGLPESFKSWFAQKDMAGLGSEQLCRDAWRAALSTQRFVAKDGLTLCKGCNNATQTYTSSHSGHPCCMACKFSRVTGLRDTNLRAAPKLPEASAGSVGSFLASPEGKAAKRVNLSKRNHVGKGLRLAEAIAAEASAATVELAKHTQQAGRLVGYVHLVPDEFSHNYDVRFWEKVPMGTKLYLAATQQAGERSPEKIQVCIDNDGQWLDFPLARRSEALAAGWHVKDFYSLAAPISEDTGAAECCGSFSPEDCPTSCTLSGSAPAAPSSSIGELPDERIDELARKTSLDGSMVIGKRSDYWRAFARLIEAEVRAARTPASVGSDDVLPKWIDDAKGKDPFTDDLITEIIRLRASQMEAPRNAVVVHSDDLAVDRFAGAMKAKMAASRAKGRGGWDDPAQCTVEKLAAMLCQHAEKGDPVDIANFAMMIHERKGSAIDVYEALAVFINARMMGERHQFKNFHRSLCARFGYTHDERDWKRDQVSLEEYIASLLPVAPDTRDALTDEKGAAK